MEHDEVHLAVREMAQIVADETAVPAWRALAVALDIGRAQAFRYMNGSNQLNTDEFTALAGRWGFTVELNGDGPITVTRRDPEAA